MNIKHNRVTLEDADETMNNTSSSDMMKKLKERYLKNRSGSESAESSSNMSTSNIISIREIEEEVIRVDLTEEENTGNVEENDENVNPNLMRTPFIANKTIHLRNSGGERVSLSLTKDETGEKTRERGKESHFTHMRLWNMSHFSRNSNISLVSNMTSSSYAEDSPDIPITLSSVSNLSTPFFSNESMTFHSMPSLGSAISWEYTTSRGLTHSRPENLLSSTTTGIKVNNLTLPKNPKDFKDFGLIPNTDRVLSPSEQTHLLLPKKLKDNEVYKSKLIEYLRKPEFTGSKTETNKYMQKSQKRMYSDCFAGGLSGQFAILSMKRRKVTSEKKIFEADRTFEDNRAEVPVIEEEEEIRVPPQYFKCYNDREIGIPKAWQRQLKEAEMDDDVETDSEQLRAAGRHILKELSDGIAAFNKNRRNVRNLPFLEENKGD